MLQYRGPRILKKGGFIHAESPRYLSDEHRPHHCTGTAARPGTQYGAELPLARNSCYTGHSIQRIVPGYVVDASYNAFGKEMACYLIDNESTSHGYNHLRLEPGTIAMGGYGEPGIAGGEFFFPLAWNEKLRTTTPASGG